MSDDDDLEFRRELDHELDLLEGYTETFRVTVTDDPVFSHWSVVRVVGAGDWSVVELFGPDGIGDCTRYWRDESAKLLDRDMYRHQPTAGPDFVGPVPDTYLASLLQNITAHLAPHRVVIDNRD